MQTLSTGKTLKNDKVSGGFTLIELLVVLILISLMSAFVIPRVITPFGNLNAKTSARELAGILRHTRSQAVSEKVEKVAAFDLGGGHVRIFSTINSSQQDQKNRSSQTRTDLAYDLPNNVRFKSAAAGKDEVEEGEFFVLFFPNGSSSGGEVVLSGDSGKRYLVGIDSITGIVKVAEMEK